MGLINTDFVTGTYVSFGGSGESVGGQGLNGKIVVIVAGLLLMTGVEFTRYEHPR